MNIKRAFFITFLMLVGGSFALVSAETSTQETLTIGYIGMSGGSQGQSDTLLYQAAVLAAEELNADEDSLIAPDDSHYQLTVTYYDADTASDAISALSDAVNDNAIAVLGPQEVEFGQAIADNGTPEVAVIMGAPDAPTGTDIFRATSDYNTWAQVAANYLVSERHFTKVAIVGANTDVAQSNLDAFRASVDNDLIVADLTHTADEDDFSSDARSIRDADAEAVYVSTLDAQMLAFLTALKTEGWQGTIVYDSLDASFLAKADASLVEGIYGTTQWSSVAYDGKSQAFAANYSARWGVTPPDNAVAYYDAVYMLAEAIANTGATASDIKNALNNNEYVGVQGTYTHTTISATLLLQVGEDKQLSEAARYASTVCVNCPDYWLADNTATETTASATFNIGLMAALDGVMVADGDAIENATKLAIRDINDMGGVIGSDGVRYTLALTTYNATTSAESETAFTQATQDGMSVILGPDANGQVLNNLYGAQQASTTQMVSATNTQITANEPSNYVFQLRANDNALVTASADYLLNVREMTRFATVAVRTDYGLDAIKTFSDAVKASDHGQLITRFEHDVTDTDLADLAQNIVDAKVDAVAVWTTQPAFQSLWTALNSLDWQGTLVYGYLTPELVKTLSVSTTIELLAPSNWWDVAGDWVSHDFTTRYVARYGTQPTPQSASYYDAVYLIADAMRNQGASSTDIQAWLLDLTSFTAVQGTYSPSTYANGELTRTVEIVRINGSSVEEVARYNGTTCLVGCN